MGERKVLNFYVSPDFDHSIIPKMKRQKGKLAEVRTMLPFSIRCDTCGEYMYAGKKFNAKKELIKDEDYLGIRKFRFIIKCSVCSSEISFKTDPKNSDYECERGASRNYEVWRDTEETIKNEKALREEEDKMDALKSLENRAMDSKIEMDIMDALEEIKAIHDKHEKVNKNNLIDKIIEKKSNELPTNSSNNKNFEENDEEELKKFLEKKKNKKLIHDDDDDDENDEEEEIKRKKLKSNENNLSSNETILNLIKNQKQTSNNINNKVNEKVIPTSEQPQIKIVLKRKTEEKKNIVKEEIKKEEVKNMFSEYDSDD